VTVTVTAPAPVGPDVSDLDPEAPTGTPESYSYRPRPETAGQIWWNRISVTASLFATATGAAFLLGRKR
jgi:hypothetical protein